MKPSTNKKIEISNRTIAHLRQQISPEGFTIVHCKYTSKEIYVNGGWVNIFPTTYLFRDGFYLKLEHAENIPVAPEKFFFDKAGLCKAFTLYFPLIPKEWESFDLIEKTNTGEGFIHQNIIRNTSGVYQLSIK